MQYIKGNVYSNDFLRFSIEKPANWIFLPGEWTWNNKEMIMENAPEMRETLAKSSTPFVYFYLSHNEPDYPCPTVQGLCRINRGYQLNEQFAEIPNGLKELLPNSEILESTTNYIIAGQRALYLKFKFTIPSEDGKNLACLGRTVLIIRPDYLFTIGLTGSLEGKYQCEEEFTDILKSVRVGSMFGM